MSSITTKNGQIVHAIGSARTFVMAFMFLLVSVFGIAITVVGFDRLLAGQWVSALIVLTFAAIIFWMFVMVALELIEAGHFEVRIGEDGIAGIVPTFRGTTPWFPYRKFNMRYDEIARVEHRGELYGFWSFLGVSDSFRVIDKKGRAIQLGHQHEYDEDPAVDVRVLAAEIAKRAGVELRDRGTVQGRGPIAALLNGGAPWNVKALDPDYIHRLRRRNAAVFRTASYALFVSVVLSVAWVFISPNQSVFGFVQGLMQGPSGVDAVQPAQPAKPGQPTKPNQPAKPTQPATRP